MDRGRKNRRVVCGREGDLEQETALGLGIVEIVSNRVSVLNHNILHFAFLAFDKNKNFKMNILNSI